MTIRHGAALMAGAILAACGGSRGGSPAPEPPASFSVAGTLTYHARVALAPDAEAVVEVREDAGADAPLAGERRIPLDGKQVPVVFDLRVDRARLDGTKRYVLRAAFREGGRPTWVSDAVPLDVTARGVDVGTLLMRPHAAAGSESALQCGDRAVTIAWRDGAALLTAGGETFELAQARAASGARYVSREDSTTWLWNKGERTRVSVRGTELPECITQRPGESAGAPTAKPYRARGNEPFWSVELGPEHIVFRTPEGAPAYTPVPEPQDVPGGRRWTAHTEAHRLVLTVLVQRCVDDMSGMPYPHVVTVELDGRTYRGCGGETAALLHGAEWVVEDVDGKGIIDRSRLTLLFAEDGRVSGRAGCNTYTGGYTLTGESLTIAKTATTMRACAPSLMEQEARFLAALQATDRLEFTPDGALVLRGGADRSVTARR